MSRKKSAPKKLNIVDPKYNYYANNKPIVKKKKN